MKYKHRYPIQVVLTSKALNNPETWEIFTRPDLLKNIFQRDTGEKWVLLDSEPNGSLTYGLCMEERPNETS